MAGSEKGKLLPTDIGIVVNDFLMENFPNIMNYNFTAFESTDAISANSNKLASTASIASPGNFFLPIYAILAQVKEDTYNEHPVSYTHLSSHYLTFFCIFIGRLLRLLR